MIPANPAAPGVDPVGPGSGWYRPAPRLLTLRLVELGVGGLVALIVVAAVLAVVAGAVAAGIGAAVVAAGSGAAVLPLRRRVAAWGYAERDDDLVVRRGVLVRRLSVIPYGRMQFVDVTAGPAERMFGLSTVRMHTAAAASDARIPGLGHDEASRLRDQLTALGEAHAAGL